MDEKHVREMAFKSFHAALLVLQGLLLLDYPSYELTDLEERFGTKLVLTETT